MRADEVDVFKRSVPSDDFITCCCATTLRVDELDLAIGLPPSCLGRTALLLVIMPEPRSQTLLSLPEFLPANAGCQRPTVVGLPPPATGGTNPL